MDFKYSLTLSSFRELDTIESSLKKISKSGFDAIEMYGEPEKVDIKKFKELFGTYGFSICGITGMWGSISKDGWKRKLLSTDIGIRKNAEEYVKKCVKMCNELEGNEVNVCLFADDKKIDVTHHVIPIHTKKKVLKKICPLMSRLARFSNDYGVKLLLEPLNRYSTPYFTTHDDAIFVLKEMDSNASGVLLDTFHMNIEEDSFESAIMVTNEMLYHMHFADNNRKMPGYGHIDFKSIVKSLSKIKYKKYISFEPVIQQKNYSPTLKKGLAFVKTLARQN